MPTQKRDTKTDRKQNWMMLAGAAVPLAGAAALQWFGSSLAFYISIPIGIGCIGWALFSPHFYRCPQCGTRLRFLSPPQEGVAIKYFCRGCDVEWDTGWSTGSDGSSSDPGTPSKADAPMPDEVLASIQEAVFQNRKVEAIKQCRDSTGATLSEAVYRVERLEDDLRHKSPEKFSGPRGRNAKDAAS